MVVQNMRIRLDAKTRRLVKVPGSAGVSERPAASLQAYPLVPRRTRADRQRLIDVLVAQSEKLGLFQTR